MSEQSTLEKIPVLARKLRELREGRGWTRQDLAEKMKGNGYTSNRHIQRAENCEKGVSLVFYRRMAEALGTTLAELLESPVSPFNVPHARNPFFTGREEILEQVRRGLAVGGVTLTQTQAISGLGGIGKTQIAVEYAYRYQQDYRAVLWTQADSYDDLVSGFVAMANLLNLPQKGAADQNLGIAAVKGWLERTAGWLLIFDNADSPEGVKVFMPRHPKGHILLTSRAQMFDGLGIGTAIQLDTLRPDEAVEFLFYRTGRSCPEILEPIRKPNPPPPFPPGKGAGGLGGVVGELPDWFSELEAAQQLAAELDYLPLALEQAGAYIVRLWCCFRDYLASFRQRGLDLLEKTPATGQYPRSVATTWRLNFEQVEKKSAASAELLRLSAFLYPDSIPLELFTHGKTALRPALSKALARSEEDPLVLDEVLEPLMQYSLIRREPGARTYSIHRLVQAVLRAGLDAEAHRRWVNDAVKALNDAFPPAQYEYWHRCELLLPHVQTCAEHMEKWKLGTEEAVRLFNRAGVYLTQRGRLDEAEGLHRQSLAMCERFLPPNHPATAQCLCELGGLLASRNRFAEAERMLRRALEIQENTLGDHPDTAQSLAFLGGLVYRWKGCIDEAEGLMRQALTIQEKCLGTDDLKTIGTLEDLGIFYCSHQRFSEAERCWQKVLTIREKTLGLDHPDTGQVLCLLGGAYHKQGKFVEAELARERALAIQRKTLGPENPFTVMTVGALAQVYHAQGKVVEAERLYGEWFRTIERSAYVAHPSLIEGLEGYAALLRGIGRDDEARALENRAREIQAEHGELAEQSPNNS